MKKLIIVASMVLVAAAPEAPAQAPLAAMTPDIAAPYNSEFEQADFVRREATVPMRDGTKLYTTWVMKKGATNAPIILQRTPYDAHSNVNRNSSLRGVDILPVMNTEMFEQGYILVYQDIRGLHRSEGQFVMTRPIVGPLNSTGIDESTDAYDTIDWLVKNIPETNGKVGIIGSSYPGFLAAAATINPHPALKAAVPQSPMIDGWRGDDWFHNGAFRVGGFDFGLAVSTNKFDGGASVPQGEEDDYSRYLSAGSAGDFAARWHMTHVPFVQKLFQHPAYDSFWSGQAVDKWLAANPLKVPTMLVVGQWDQEDSYGAPAAYRALEPKDTSNDMVNLVIGPWRHSGANHTAYNLGELILTGDTAREWRVKYLMPFFDHWLKGAPDPHTPPVLTYATGPNRWQVSDRWPVGTATPFYLGSGRTASFGASSAGRDSYVSDPAAPVPYLPRPINGAGWRTWLVHDQRLVDGRPDVMTFAGPVLDRQVQIMGAPEADIYLSTSGTDTDVVVKLIDIYPNDIPEPAEQGGKPSMAGFELPVGIEIFRGRYIDDFAKPHALKAGKTYRFRFSLPNVNHVFLPGHRIAVQVQSSLFPVYDRNPQTYVPNIFFAKRDDYKKATITVAHGGGTPSAIWLPIVQ